MPNAVELQSHGFLLGYNLGLTHLNEESRVSGVGSRGKPTILLPITPVCPLLRFFHVVRKRLQFSGREDCEPHLLS